MVSGKVLWCEGRLTKKDLKHHMVLWEGSLVRRSTHKKKLETPHGFLGRFSGAKVDSQKRLETPHGFLGRFFGAKVDSQKNLKRHMVLCEESWCEG